MAKLGGPSKFAHKRNVVQREVDLTLIARLYCERKTLQQIAEAVSATRDYSISRSQVYLDVQELIGRLQEEQKDHLVTQRAREVMAINNVERLAHDAFLKERVRTTTEQRTGALPRKAKRAAAAELKRAMVVRDTGGAAIYLQIILQCIKRRCELLGLDTPVRTEISGPQGGPVLVHSFEEALLKSYAPRDDAPAAGAADRN